jgi:Acetyl-CoA hydrolase/transferase N-terminal domain
LSWRAASQKPTSAGQKFQVSVFTGASTGPELDGALAMAGGIHLRLPYQSDPETRKRINAGEMEYMDIHLSHVAQFVEYGFLGKLDVALIKVTAVSMTCRSLSRSRIGRPARTFAAAAPAPRHREVLESGLQTFAPRRSKPSGAAVVRQTYAAPAE